jgi:hypothetical protein
VLPHGPNAWIDLDKTKIGYEIPFTRSFYRHIKPLGRSTIEVGQPGSPRSVAASHRRSQVL